MVKPPGLPSIRGMRRQPLLPVRRVGRERSLVRALGSADGFGLIETVIALSIFAIVSVSVMGLLTGSINSVSLARQKTLAEQVAASELESIRADASTTSGYANDLGTVNGKPGGIYPNMQYNLSANGLTYNEQIQISWVNDPAPTAYTSYADYKQVTVTILRSSDSKVLTRQTTYVSPGNTSNYGGSSDGIAKAQVIDMGNNTPVAGVSVALTGPGAPQSDTTDATGTVMFPALPATSGSQYYTFAVTPPYGYVNLSDDVSPSTASHFQLVGGQTFSTALRVYRPATVYVNVLSDGVTYPGTATVTLTSSEPTQTINWNGASSTRRPRSSRTASPPPRSSRPCRTRTRPTSPRPSTSPFRTFGSP